MDGDRDGREAGLSCKLTASSCMGGSLLLMNKAYAFAHHGTHAWLAHQDSCIQTEQWLHILSARILRGGPGGQGAGKLRPCGTWALSSLAAAQGASIPGFAALHAPPRCPRECLSLQVHYLVLLWLGVDCLTMLDHGAPTSPILAYASDHPVAMAPNSGFGNVRISAPIRPLPSAALWQ
eukprot:363729-Chlamydomonas_euryale.AAC.6